MNKTIAKNVGYASAIGVLGFTLQACGKYDDGPGLSLRTKKARLVGEWEVTQIGSQAFPSGGYSLEMEFEKDGDLKYTYSYGTYSYSYIGDWEFSSDKEELDIVIGGSVTTFEIKRLTNKEFWFEDESNDEWKLEAQ